MVEVSVFAQDAIQGQLVADHIGQYLSNTGFSNVNVDRSSAGHIPEPSSQSDALQAIRNLNPELFDMPVNITPEVGATGGGVNYPDGPGDQD